MIVDLAPDLIILDHLRGPEDAGWTLLRRLKTDQSTQTIPVVVCTGAARRVEAVKAELDRMGVQVVYKPFDIDQLLKVIATVLSEARSPQGHLSWTEGANTARTVDHHVRTALAPIDARVAELEHQVADLASHLAEVQKRAQDEA